MTTREPLRPMATFFPFAAVIAAASVVFSSGVFVGRNGVQLEVVTLREQLAAHQQLDAHPGAMRTDLIAERLTQIQRDVARNSETLRTLTDQVRTFQRETP